MAEKRAARQPKQQKTGHNTNTVLDLIALLMILIAIVAVVVFGNASAAVVAAVGGAIAVAFRAWRALQR